MKQDLKFWYYHIFFGMKQRVKGLNMMREMGQISPDDFAKKVLAELEDFDKRNIEFIEIYVAPKNQAKFRKMIDKLANPKPSFLVKIMHFIGL